MKISFHSHANKTNFHIKSFALNLAFIVRFIATRKWSILLPLPYSSDLIPPVVVFLGNSSVCKQNIGGGS